MTEVAVPPAAAGAPARPGRPARLARAASAANGRSGGTPVGPTETEWAAAVAVIRELAPGGRALLICHVNPDGDALGSMLGTALGLQRLGVRQLQCTFPGPLEVPAPYQELPGLELLVAEGDADTDPDLVLCFDAAAESRLGALIDRVERARASVVLDHHASNTRFGGTNLVDPDVASSSMVDESLLARLDVPLAVRIAEVL